MKKFIYGAMSFGLLFTACSSDTLNEPTGGDNSGVERTYYVNLTIHGDQQGTRSASENGNPSDATDFEDGTGDESEVTSAYFVFYDDNGNQVGDVVSAPIENKTGGPIGETVEANYLSVVSVTVPKDITPTQVVCYLNPPSIQVLQNPLDQIQTVTLQNSVNEDGGFPMSNSVYYPETGNTAEPQIAVSVVGKLYDTYADASAQNAETVNVYVERYATKLSFDATKVLISDNSANAYNPVYETYSYVYQEDGSYNPVEVSLQFVPERWALNAVAENTYIVKSFREENPTTGSFLPNNYYYNALNSSINALNNTSWEWNNVNYHRSYWGMSPAYFTVDYPVVEEDVQEAFDNGTLQQYYYKYSELSGDNPKGYAGNDKSAYYFNETTVGRKALNSVNPAAAVASVILVGHYNMTVDGNAVAEGTTFYTYLRSGLNNNALVYFDSKEGTDESVVSGGESMLRRFYAAASVIYKQDSDGSYVRLDPNNTEDLDMLNGAFEVAAPTQETLQDQEVAARYRTLQIKAENPVTTGIYVIDNNKYKSIASVGTTTPGENEVTIAQANNIILKQVGYANKYQFSKAYYNIPVKHTGWYRTGNPNNQAGAVFDWAFVNVGDFGMVRNHKYSLVVDKISGLATGIGGEDDFIVPPADTKDYYVSYRINILRWAIVPIQHVTLQ